jgi:DNA repair protein RadC
MRQSTFDLNGQDQTPLIACGEQPQQRFENYGAAALSDTELIAIMLHSGIRGHSVLGLASQLIGQAGSIAGLASWQPEDFQRLKGIGRAKGQQLAAVIEIARRMMKQPDTEAPLLNRPELIAEYLAPYAKGIEVEKFWVLCLNRKNRLKKLVEVTSGTATGSLVHARETFRAAIQHGATAVAVAHNL